MNLKSVIAESINFNFANVLDDEEYCISKFEIYVYIQCTEHDKLVVWEEMHNQTGN